VKRVTLLHEKFRLKLATNQTVSFPMAKDQPGVASVVVAFVARHRLPVYLTPLDRMDICQWRDATRDAGYDRMVIHEREEGDDREFGDFLCLHRRGEAWSRWGFARKGNVVSVWCCLTGADIGEFASMSEAFEAVLPGTAIPIRHPQPNLGIVTDLLPRLRQTANRLGSAA
jgi:hypothetical protein